MVRDGICVSNSFYVVFYPILAPIPNFIQIGRKTQKLKIFNNLVGFGWLGQQDEKLSWASITHSMLFFVHYQPPYQILDQVDYSYLLRGGRGGWGRSGVGWGWQSPPPPHPPLSILPFSEVFIIFFFHALTPLQPSLRLFSPF